MSKPAETYRVQIQILRDRGLLVADESFARHCLAHHIRNTAAHHSRLWNRKFVVTFQLPKKKPQHLWPNFSTCRQQDTGRERNLYNTLVLLVHLIQCIEPAGDWPQRLVNHLGTLDSALQPGMGCPANWRELPLWQSLATGGGAV